MNSCSFPLTRMRRTRSKKFIRNARGTTTLSKADEGIVKTYMPYAR